MTSKRHETTIKNIPRFSSFENLYKERESLQSKLETCQVEKHLCNNRLAAVLTRLESRMAPSLSSSPSPIWSSSSAGDQKSSRSPGSSPDESKASRAWVKHRNYEARTFTKEIEKQNEKEKAITQELFTIKTKIEELGNASISDENNPQQQDVVQIDCEESETLAEHDHRPTALAGSVISSQSDTLQDALSPVSNFALAKPRSMATELNMKSMHGFEPENSVTPDKSIEMFPVLASPPLSVGEQNSRSSEYSLDISRSDWNWLRRDSGFTEPPIIFEGSPMIEAEYSNHIYSHELIYQEQTSYRESGPHPTSANKENAHPSQVYLPIHKSPASLGPLFYKSMPAYRSPGPHQAYDRPWLDYWKSGGDRKPKELNQGRSWENGHQRSVHRKSAVSLAHKSTTDRKQPPNAVPRAPCHALPYHNFSPPASQESRMYAGNRNRDEELSDEGTQAQQTHTGHLKASDYESDLKQTPNETENYKRDGDGEVKARFKALQKRDRRFKLRRSYSMDARDMFEQLEGCRC